MFEVAVLGLNWLPSDCLPGDRLPDDRLPDYDVDALDRRLDDAGNIP